jgi:hypothetical protein
MDQLRLCVNVLRSVARQYPHASRQLLIQRQIIGYLRREADDPRASLERLANAIEEEAKQGGDWSSIQEYVQVCLDKVPDESEV